MNLDEYISSTDLPAFTGGDHDQYARQIAKIGAYAGAAWATAHSTPIIHINQVCDHDIAPPDEPVVEVHGDTAPAARVAHEVMQDVMNQPTGGIMPSHY